MFVERRAARATRPEPRSYLSREEEHALILRATTCADRDASDRLVRAHLPQVTRLAQRYCRYGVPLNDLVAEGNYGLLHALEKFDAERGVRFATYAQHWMRAYMVAHVLKTWSLVSSGCRALGTRWFFRLRRERARYAGIHGSDATAEQDLAERVGVTTDDLRTMLEHIHSRDLSLEAPAAPDSPTRFVDLLRAPDDQETTLLERQVEGSLSSAVASALATLDPRERYIAERRLMAENGEMLTLTDIARSLGVSRERARQLEDRAARKLRARIVSFGDALVHEALATRSKSATRPAGRRS